MDDAQNSQDLSAAPEAVGSIEEVAAPAAPEESFAGSQQAVAAAEVAKASDASNKRKASGPLKATEALGLIEAILARVQPPEHKDRVLKWFQD